MGPGERRAPKAKRRGAPVGNERHASRRDACTSGIGPPIGARDGRVRDGVAPPRLSQRRTGPADGKYSASYGRFLTFACGIFSACAGCEQRLEHERGRRREIDARPALVPEPGRAGGARSL